MTDEEQKQVLAKMRKDLEERGVIGAAKAEKRVGGYGIKRSALNAYKERHGVDYVVPAGAIIIEDL